MNYGGDLIREFKSEVQTLKVFGLAPWDPKLKSLRSPSLIFVSFQLYLVSFTRKFFQRGAIFGGKRFSVNKMSETLTAWLLHSSAIPKVRCELCISQLTCSLVLIRARIAMAMVTNHWLVLFSCKWLHSFWLDAIRWQPWNMLMYADKKYPLHLMVPLVYRLWSEIKI